MRHLAAHPPGGFETAGVWGPGELAPFFDGLPFWTVETERDASVDVVHAHGMTAAMRALRRRRRPLVVTVHTDIRTQGRLGRWPLLRPAARRLVDRADAVIAVSDRVARSLARAEVIQPAFDRLPPPTTSRADVRRSLATPDDRVVVVTAARLHRDKALDIFVRAVAAAGADGWICGDGPDRTHVASCAAGTAVRLLGHRDDLSDVYAAADVFALPSAGEAYGIAVVEAIQAGLPVVVTDAGAMREIAGDAGVVVGAGEEAAFRDAVRDLVTNQVRRAELAERARRATFPDPRDLVAAVGDVYRSVCG